MYQDIPIDVKQVDNFQEDDFLSVSSIKLNKPTNTIEHYDCGLNESQENNSSIKTSSFLSSAPSK